MDRNVFHARIVAAGVRIPLGSLVCVVVDLLSMDDRPRGNTDRPVPFLFVRLREHLRSDIGSDRVAGLRGVEHVTTSNETKAVITVGWDAEPAHDRFDAKDKTVLILVSDLGDDKVPMGKPRDADQRNLGLGHKDYDPEGGRREGDDGNRKLINGEVLGLPALGDTTRGDKDLQAPFDDGYKASADSNLESDCPILNGEQVIKWRRSNRAFHKDKDGLGKRHESHRLTGSGRLPKSGECRSAQDGRLLRPRGHGQTACLPRFLSAKF